MEQIAEVIKTFILEDVNVELRKLVDEKTTLPAIVEKNIVFGTVDLSRYEAPVIISILPETQTPEDGFVDGFAVKSEFTVTFIFQKENYPLLIKRMFRYAKAFRTAQEKNPDFDNNVEESEITEVKFYPDTGAVSQQMTAAEISLNIITEESLN